MLPHECETKLKKNLSRLLCLPQGGAPGWRAISAAKGITGWLLLALGAMLVAGACGGFTPADGSVSDHFMKALILLFVARYTTGPAVSLLKKLIGHLVEDVRSIRPQERAGE